MHDRSAGEIQRREFSAKRRIQETALAPNHVSERSVDEQKPQREKKHRAAELHSFRSGTGNQGRRDDRKHQLINHEGCLRNGSGVIGIWIGADAAQERMLEPADDRTVSAKRQAVAHQGPQNGNHRHEHEALHHDGQHVFAAYQAAIEKGQARAGHEQNQRGAYQHPGIVSGRLCGTDALIQLRELVVHGCRRCGGGRRQTLVSENG